MARELTEAFAVDAAKRHTPRLLLTAAVAAEFKTIGAGYEIAKLGKYLDLLNVMTYDLHGKYDFMQYLILRLHYIL